MPIVAQAILAFQTIISRSLSPLESGVVSVGVIKGGNAFNIISGEVEMSGTYRFFNAETKELIEKRIDEVLKGVTSAYGASYELKIEEIGPPTVNDPKMVELVKTIAKRMGLNAVEAKKTMGAEDFAFYLQKVPGAFIFLGTKNEAKGIVYPHHHPKFDVDEEILPLGTALEVGLAFERV
ncbi:amidohydrolase [Thermococcus sp. MV5]|uniref:M20 metallopeptidase family protein n=1 Tax=Thermococcus sp. MV5 TaxID=1638272 RepID=UPI001438B2CC|nr:M20/M25/M40 family metallo-hydrolase [Thermococcus sp. MV5]NJE26157.1 amidohydrolase [Thermococcus sp. MV5]